MNRWIYSQLVYPTYHALIGSGAGNAIRELRDHDRLPADKLERLVSMKLATLLNHAKETVPYYSDVISDEVVNSDWQEIATALRDVPVLTKDTIRSEKNRLVSRSLSGNRLDSNSTSGSTGTPLAFFTDKKSKAFRKASVIRNRKWLGISMGDTVIHLWGSPIDQRRANSFRGSLHSIITRDIFLSAYSLDDRSLHTYAQLIQKHKARLLIGYPSVLFEFGKFCEQNSISFPSLTAIICSAEALFPHQRDSIQLNFSTPVFNRYGCREVGDIAQEIPGQHGLIVNSDRVRVEILDPDGEPCDPGILGDIVVTDLDNYGMPLIRYQIGDRGSWELEGDGNRELPYPVLHTVEGRSLDVVVCPSGNRVGGTYWTILFRMRPGIESFRVVQNTKNSICIEFTRLPEIPVIDTDYFRRKIAETCGPEMNVTFREVRKISVAPHEKARLVVSNIGKTSIADLTG